MGDVDDMMMMYYLTQSSYIPDHHTSRPGHRGRHQLLPLNSCLSLRSCGDLGISFTPKEVGDHFVSIFRNGQPLPGSPFKIVVSNKEIGDASKVRVGGRGLTQATTTEQNEFFINTSDAGETINN